MFAFSFKDNASIYFWANLFGSVSLLTPVLSLFYLHRGLEYSDFFVLLLIIVVTMFLSEVPTGMFADKRGLKESLIVGQIFTIASVVLLFFANSPIEFYIISFFTGLSISFFSGCDEALIYDTLKMQKHEGTMRRVWSKIQSGTHIPAVISVLVGAFIARDLAENQFLLLITIGLAFAVMKLFALFLLHNPPKHYVSVEPVNPFTHVREGIAFLKRTPALLILFMNETFVFIPLHIFNKFDQPYLIENGLPVIFLGVLYATASIASYFLLKHSSFLEEKVPVKTLLMVSGIGILLAYLSAALFNHILIAIAVFFVLKLTNVIRGPIFSQIKNDYIPSTSRATTLSLLSAIDSLQDIIIFTSFIFIGHLGLSVIFFACAIIVFTGLLFPIVLASENKQRAINK